MQNKKIAREYKVRHERRKRNIEQMKNKIVRG
jgi:hypothetical protein